MNIPATSARKNAPFGYKALIKYASGRTYQPVRHNFKTREEAIAYAEKWVAANYKAETGK